MWVSRSQARLVSRASRLVRGFFLRLETLETLETPGTAETLETPVLFRFGPKTGDFLVQNRNETPETPETLGTPILWVSRAWRGEKAYPRPPP